jgi:2-amino-4-hydroxy-6-hydroxymethyldihydropteridine diphosphokinase
LPDNKNNAFDDAVIVALGSNLRGHYRSNRDLLEAALHRLPSVGLKVTRRSRWWRSAAWPDRTDPAYLNGVALVETALSPHEVMGALLRLEAAFGRQREAPNGPRTLDLDLIAHGRAILRDPDLVVPHPRAHERRFVMGPLAEIAPDWVHPRIGEPAANLATAATIGSDAAPFGET